MSDRRYTDEELKETLNRAHGDEFEGWDTKEAVFLLQQENARPLARELEAELECLIGVERNADDHGARHRVLGYKMALSSLRRIFAIPEPDTEEEA